LAAIPKMGRIPCDSRKGKKTKYLTFSKVKTSITSSCKVIPKKHQVRKNRASMWKKGKK